MSKFQIVRMDNSILWNKIVGSFSDYDVYYLSNYVKAFQLHGDGEPLLICYESNDFRCINVVMKRDISKFYLFKDKIEPGTIFDTITPYGYGGFLFEGNVCKEGLSRFYEEYVNLLYSEEHVIADFIRYHPLLNASILMHNVSDVVDLGKTISIDLESFDIIWENLTSKNRNMIRKSRKSGVEIFHGKGSELLDKFIPMYEDTMNKDAAISYYYFERDFYDSIAVDLEDNYEIFYASLAENVIAMAIILYANGRMHYHLSCSNVEYRNLAPSNLLLYEAACWGCKNGFKIFHLGGGLGAGFDSLYKFKEGFNRNSNNIFSIGKKVVNQKIYDRLVTLRKNKNPDFNENTSYFPLYRG